MFSPLAGWQSGHVAACKAAYAGSIPTSASKIQPRQGLFFEQVEYVSLYSSGILRQYGYAAWVAKWYTQGT